MDALQRAIEIFGTQGDLASALKVSQPAVANWILRGKIPAMQGARIERLTGGRVKLHELCPEIYQAAKRPRRKAAA